MFVFNKNQKEADKMSTKLYQQPYRLHQSMIHVTVPKLFGFPPSPFFFQTYLDVGSSDFIISCACLPHGITNSIEHNSQ